MNVRDDRNTDRLFERGDQPDRVAIRHGGTDQLTARRFQRFRLANASLQIGGGNVQHGLHGHRRAAANQDVSRFHLSAHVVTLPTPAL